MPTRDCFGADWAFSIRDAVEQFVRRAYPADLRRWPLLQSFKFDVFAVGKEHFVIVLRDNFGGLGGGIGPGLPMPFPYSDHPSLPPTMQNVDHWLTYLQQRFHLGSDDMAMVLPIHDSGRSDPQADFAFFSEEERNLWHHQLNAGIARQVAGMVTSPQTVSPPPVHITYNVSGANARVNIGSADQSANVTVGTEPALFAEILEAIRSTAKDTPGRESIEASAQRLRQEHSTGDFSLAYKEFISVVADHIQVWGPILAPYLAGLAALIGRS